MTSPRRNVAEHDVFVPMESDAEPPEPTAYEFSGYRLAVAQRELRYGEGGRALKLPARPFQLLHALLRHPGEWLDELTAKKELGSAEASNLNDDYKRLRFCLRKAAEGHADVLEATQVIENDYGNGHRIAGEIRTVYHGIELLEGSGTEGVAAVLATARRRKPSRVIIIMIVGVVSVVSLCTLMLFYLDWRTNDPANGRDAKLQPEPSETHAGEDTAGALQGFRVLAPTPDSRLRRGPVEVRWEPPQPMVVQWYQAGRCYPENACRIDGNNAMSRSPATLSLDRPGATEIKLWKPGASEPSSSFWIQVE